jgi:putative tryptophan/tyrosine transport system substrate-binding protein
VLETTLLTHRCHLLGHFAKSNIAAFKRYLEYDARLERKGMRRREFITLFGSGAAAAWPLVARAQQSTKLATIGFLAAGSASSFYPTLVPIVVRRLDELGWTEGRNLHIEYRYSEGSLEGAGEFAAEFVRMKADVILTAGDAQVLAVKKVTAETPIVFAAAGDPVGNGLVASLARPGDNVTGLAMALSETTGKRLELLREVIPGLKRVAIFGISSTVNPLVATERNAATAAAHQLGLDPIMSEVRTAEDIAPTIASLRGAADALYVCADPFVFSHMARIIAAAVAARLPIMQLYGTITKAGGLISYGPDSLDLWRRSADLIDKILRGRKPTDIPVEQPTKFNLVINLKTAKALGVTIPHNLLVLADEVIEE